MSHIYIYIQGVPITWEFSDDLYIYIAFENACGIFHEHNYAVFQLKTSNIKNACLSFFKLLSTIFVSSKGRDIYCEICKHLNFYY